MAAQQRQAVPQPETEPMGCLPALLRLTWMAFGNVALFFSAALVANKTAPVVMDVVFFTVAVGLVVVRYVDITKFKGQTSEGKPATLADWRRYAVRFSLVAVGIWGLARVAAARGWM